MAINIQNLLDAIAAKSASNTPGTLSAGESDALVNLVTETSNLYDTFYQSDSATDYSTSQEGLVKTLYSLNTDSFYFTSGRNEWRKQNFLSPTVVDQVKFQGYGDGFIPVNTASFELQLDKFSFSSETPAVSFGSIDPSLSGSAEAKHSGFGGSCHGKSRVAGYLHASVPSAVNSAIKYPFATGNTIQVAPQIHPGAFGISIYYGPLSSILNDKIYTTGFNASPGAGHIFNTASDTNVGSPPGGAGGFLFETGLGTTRYQLQGTCPSDENGYIFGGRAPLVPNLAIVNKQKFPFANENQIATPSLLAGRHGCSGIASRENGYCMFGYNPVGPFNPNGLTNSMQRWSFASDTPVSLIVNFYPSPNDDHETGSAGISGYETGYIAGGQRFGSGARSTISKFPYTSETNISPVANLTVAVAATAATQA